MADKSKSGKDAILFNAAKGALIEGDGITALADNSWFYIVAKAGSSTLPLEVGYVFKSPDSGNAITPATGDDVYPLTFTKICKVDASFSAETGTIDVTDDCANGYNSMITDGFTTISGSASGFLKFAETDGSLNATQKDYLGKFFDIVEDDGAGNYTLTSKDDDDIILAILKNSDQATTVGNDQNWLLVPAILTSNTLDNPLKGAQPFDFNWTKGEGAASLYVRVTNASETVF
jgi:hypothetical protein